MRCESITVSSGINAAMSRLQPKGLEMCLHLRRGMEERGVESMAISKSEIHMLRNK
jgi:hypothetical protein